MFDPNLFEQKIKRWSFVDFQGLDPSSVPPGWTWRFYGGGTFRVAGLGTSMSPTLQALSRAYHPLAKIIPVEQGDRSLNIHKIMEVEEDGSKSIKCSFLGPIDGDNYSVSYLDSVIPSDAEIKRMFHDFLECVK